MVFTAYIATLISASPQTVIFRVLKHPEKEFYQCTTFDFFEDLSSYVQIGNDPNNTELLLHGLTPVQCEDLYHTIFNIEVFFGPLCAIVASYAKIYFVLKGQVGKRNMTVNKIVYGDSNLLNFLLLN